MIVPTMTHGTNTARAVQLRLSAAPATSTANRTRTIGDIGRRLTPSVSQAVPNSTSERRLHTLQNLLVFPPSSWDDSDMHEWPEFRDFDGWVQLLATPHRSQRAYAHLRYNEGTLAAVQRGLDHPDGRVRTACCVLLDHLADGESYDLLLVMLDDEEPRARLHALHALACDRCKSDDVCTLPRSEVLPEAIRVLANDPDAHVRAMACEVVGKYVHEDEDAVAALTRASSLDSDPAVRKKAAWYAPGGTIFRKTLPKQAKRQA